VRARGQRPTAHGKDESSSTELITAALQSYADRGVFRGFRATAAPPGRIAYQFQWLLRRPTHATFEARRSVLKFDALFPAVDPKSPLAVDLRMIVASRSTRTQPSHKRVDARRATLSSAVRGGTWSLTVAIRGSNHEYAVKAALNVINEIFVMLQERHPEYLIEQFGMSME
jgi:hypothetical protein